MNERDITDMACEAGFETMITKGKIHGFDRDGDYTEELKSFAALIRADEREACAKVCESYLSESPHSWGGTTMAAAIRARGQA